MRGPSDVRGETPPSPVRPDDLRPRYQAPATGAQTERGRKSWPHVLSPRGEGPEPGTWRDRTLRAPMLRHIDAMGLAREDDWTPGAEATLPAAEVARLREKHAPSPAIAAILDRTQAGEALTEADIVALFKARGR